MFFDQLGWLHLMGRCSSDKLVCVYINDPLVQLAVLETLLSNRLVCTTTHDYGSIAMKNETMTSKWTWKGGRREHLGPCSPCCLHPTVVLVTVNRLADSR